MNKKTGFTLVELAIVIVIIGLLVGGILQGQELIKQASISSQISQIGKYQTSQKTFFAKYNFLPGDIRDPEATRFGFKPRGTNAGQGDGDGMIQGVYTNAAASNGTYQQQGETCMFWVDLSTAKLIDGSFTGCNTNSTPVAYIDSNINLLFPEAKMGNGNHFFAFSWQPSTSSFGGGNFFSISKGLPNTTSSATGLTVLDAYSIDAKLDDGLPQSGKVSIVYMQVNGSNPWWSGAGYNNINTVARAGTSTSCFDNNNTAGQSMKYSLEQASDSLNCALSIQFQ